MLLLEKRGKQEKFVKNLNKTDRILFEFYRNFVKIKID